MIYKGLPTEWSTMKKLAFLHGSGEAGNRWTWQKIVKMMQNGETIPVGTEFSVPQADYGGPKQKITFIVRRTNVDKVHGDPNAPTCTIQTKYLLRGKSGYSYTAYLTFTDAPESMYAPLSAPIQSGTVCKFTLPESVGKWTAGAYNFSPAVDLPTGTVLKLPSSSTSEITSLKIIAFTDQSCKTALGEFPITNDTGNATRDLGAFENDVYRVVYGSNNFAQSYIFQFLNADGKLETLWTPKTVYDTPQNYGVTNNLKGFLAGFPAEFKAHLGLADIHCITNDVYETGGYTTDAEYITQGYFWLPSKKEIVGTGSSLEASETQFPYYAENTGSEYRKMHTESESVSRSYILRTPGSGRASNRNVITDTGANFSTYPSSSYACIAPMAILTP